MAEPEEKIGMGPEAGGEGLKAKGSGPEAKGMPPKGAGVAQCPTCKLSLLHCECADTRMKKVVPVGELRK